MITGKQIKHFNSLSKYGQIVSTIDRKINKLKFSVNSCLDQLKDKTFDDEDIRNLCKTRLKHANQLIHDLKKQKQTVHRIYETWKKFDNDFYGEYVIFEPLTA